MEDILASIRRILSEDETINDAPAHAAEGSATDAATDDVFDLDLSMLVNAPNLSAQARSKPDELAPVQPSLSETALLHKASSPMKLESLATEAPVPPTVRLQEDISALVAPEATAAASASMGTLLRTLAADRHAAVYRGGPTLEDMVRDEMRPILKQWLDSNLPAMVERIVRAEIERVTHRATS
jgi:cell pole-organizing protein PopZ